MRMSEPLEVGMDDRAHRGLVPLENKRPFLEGDVMEQVTPIFDTDPLITAIKALGTT